VTLDNGEARGLAVHWIESKKENIATSGWCTYAGLLATKADQDLDLAEIEALLERIVHEISRAQNRVRQTMNAFVIAVGSYVTPLSKNAKVAARQIGEVSTDVGDTACKIPLATAYIAKVEAAGRVGRKRKTMRC
jgi:hypothetical protein